MIESKIIVERQRSFFSEHATLSCEFRIDALRRLAAAIRQHEPLVVKALWVDLRKSEFESYATEIGIVLGEIESAIKNLNKWARPRRAKTPLVFFGSRSKVCSQPYGVVLILSPWNYPFQLLLSPLVGAIAAGNCAVLKPSPQCGEVAAVVKKIVESAFDPGYVTIADIDNSHMDNLLAQRFDYIFYTGGVSYGKHIMSAAAVNLTPVTLELGGKSPCIVDRDANLAIAARRIVWGKLLNAGQTCVAPDYLLVHKDVRPRLVELLTAEIERQYGVDPALSPDYPRVVSQAHCQRLKGLLSLGKIVVGGQVDIDHRYVEPTILVDVDLESPLMTDEIFGPLLPVVDFDTIDQAIEFVNNREKPLALYCFTESRRQAAHVLQHTTSGGACVNDVVVHVGNGRLPFGGVGNSGMGNYHGTYGFRTFSHYRAVMTTVTWFNLGVKFAPYGKKLKILKQVMK